MAIACDSACWRITNEREDSFGSVSGSDDPERRAAAVRFLPQPVHHSARVSIKSL